ncbi:unnamed protein product, partial [marine sediment metagenome]
PNCIIRVSSIKQPFHLTVPLIKRKSIDAETIKSINQKILGEKYSGDVKKDYGKRSGMNRGIDEYFKTPTREKKESPSQATKKDKEVQKVKRLFNTTYSYYT